MNKINEDGIRYYNNVINELLTNNIKPMVTLYHWDLPQSLQEIGGWPNIVLAEIFEDYARIVFKYFGDRVKTWITFNEPPEICHTGYGVGSGAPSYNSNGIGDYMCGRTLLIAHAKAYHLYNKEFRSEQKGRYCNMFLFFFNFINFFLHYLLTNITVIIFYSSTCI